MALDDDRYGISIYTEASGANTLAEPYVLAEADYETDKTVRLKVRRPQGLTISLLCRGEVSDRPLSATKYMGSSERDFTDVGLYIVTARFREVVVHQRLTGSVFAPLLVEGEVGHWWLMGIIGTCSQFDYSQSEHFTRVIKRATGGETHQRRLRGFTIDRASHSGHDFVLPPRVNQALVTGRVVDAFTREGLTNVSFTPIDRYEISQRIGLGSSDGTIE